MKLTRNENGTWLGPENTNLHWTPSRFIQLCIEKPVTLTFPDGSTYDALRPVPITGDEEPTHIQAKRHNDFNRAGWAPIYLKLDALKLIRTQNGGIRYRSEDGRVGVDCKSHTYSMFLYEDFCKEMVIAVDHGGGSFFHYFRDLFAANTLISMAESIGDEAFYDFCNVLIRAVESAEEAGADKTRKEMETAFLEGRLKKRSRKGRKFAEVVS